MSLFDTLLTKRDLTRAPIPLWKLKVTDEEYEELKETIYRVATAPYGAAGFRTIERECALLFSEYWRRDYIDGPHKLQAVKKTLKYRSPSTTTSIRFTKQPNAEQKGWESNFTREIQPSIWTLCSIREVFLCGW